MDDKKWLDSLSPEDRAAVEEDVTYRAPTGSAAKATGAPEGAPVLADRNFNLLSAINPANAALDTVQKGADVVKKGTEIAGDINELAKYGSSAGTTAVELPDYLKLPIQGDVSATGAEANLAKDVSVKGIRTKAEGDIAAAEEAKKQIQDVLTGAGDYSPQAFIELNRKTDDAIAKSVAIGKQFDDFANLPQDQKIDPTRYVKNLGVGDKTLLSLGMVLSGIGAGLTGGPNMAKDILQKNIDRDIAAQTQVNTLKLSSLASAQGVEVNKANMVQMQITSRLLAQRQVLAGIEAQANQAVNKAKSQGERDAAQAVRFQIQQRKNETDQAFANQLKGMVQRGDTKQLGLVSSGLENSGLINDRGLPARNAQQPQQSKIPKASEVLEAVGIPSDMPMPESVKGLKQEQGKENPYSFYGVGKK